MQNSFDVIPLYKYLDILLNIMCIVGDFILARDKVNLKYI